MIKKSFFDVYLEKQDFSKEFILKFIEATDFKYLNDINIKYDFRIIEKESSYFVDISYRIIEDAEKRFPSLSKEMIQSNIAAFLMSFKEEINKFNNFLLENGLDFNDNSKKLYTLNNGELYAGL